MPLILKFKILEF